MIPKGKVKISRKWLFPGTIIFSCFDTAYRFFYPVKDPFINNVTNGSFKK